MMYAYSLYASEYRSVPSSRVASGFPVPRMDKPVEGALGGIAILGFCVTVDYAHAIAVIEK
jgi:hypothetical protein